MAATARRFSICAASVRRCTCRVNAASSGSTGSRISASPAFFTAITARIERIRHACASTVSTSPEKRAASSPGFCAESVAAGRRVSFRDISARSAWVIF